MKLLTFLLLITLTFAGEINFNCKINITEHNILFDKAFKFKFTEQKSTCPHVPDGTIKFEQDSLEKMKITIGNETYIPTILYDVYSYKGTGYETTKLNDMSNFAHFTTTSETLALTKNHYRVGIILSYEIRKYTNLDEASAAPTPNTNNTQNSTEEFAHYYSCKSGTELVEIQSKLGEYTFLNPQGHANTRCSGNHGAVSCNISPQTAPEGKQYTFQLEGTDHFENKYGDKFENIPVGQYKCQLVVKDYCTFTSKEIEVKAKDDCKPIDEWLDYQLYGEGQAYFYVGFIIGAIALLLNIIMLICSFKLCCSAEGSVERLAEEMAAEYRSRHGVEMN